MGWEVMAAPKFTYLFLQIPIPGTKFTDLLLQINPNKEDWRDREIECLFGIDSTLITTKKEARGK